ncbi:MAG TPA: HD domain-containing protein [Gaiellaceae bacterium]|nr:HD domain-containing protein [Gaiellaceae bacterium]
MSSMLGERFLDALPYAARLHGPQKRKGTSTPYVAHLLGVCSLVLEDGGDEDEAIAALLHDAVEDQDGRSPERLLAEIRDRFGERVASIVDECTETLERPKPPWPERKAAYLAHLEHASASALRVSLADKLYNASVILRDYRLHGDELWARFNPDGGKERILRYYTDLVELFGRRSKSPMTQELARIVAELKSISRP